MGDEQKKSHLWTTIGRGGSAHYCCVVLLSVCGYLLCLKYDSLHRIIYFYLLNPIYIIYKLNI